MGKIDMSEKIHCKCGKLATHSHVLFVGGGLIYTCDDCCEYIQQGKEPQADGTFKNVD